MSNVREYIVSVKDFNDLDSLYNDIENIGTGIFSALPSRAVECCARRPISKNTHYMLTDDEASIVRNDPRVYAVTLNMVDSGLTVVRKSLEHSNNWTKNFNITSQSKNWGLLRVTNGQTISGWGTNGTTEASGNVSLNSGGLYVDVVICDGHFIPDHPEFAVNADGTGGSRKNEYNWFLQNPTVTGGAVGNYVYTPYTDPNNQNAIDDNNHGCHVAGIACGNSQGWARNATIYNISPYDTNPNPNAATYVFDYIRAWHQTKPINPKTGRQNPTIVNCSWGIGSTIPINSISSITYRGTTINGPFTGSTINSYGLFSDDNLNVTAPARFSPTEVDIQSAIDDGIIIVSAAGNSYEGIFLSTQQDYNNYLTSNGSNYLYNQGDTPGAADNVICVGSAGSLVIEKKADYSCCGTRINIWAPGDYITSAWNNTYTNGGGQSPVIDPRNSSYNIQIDSGTSMASPQVTGVLACALETYPGLTATTILSYIKSVSTTNQLTDSGTPFPDLYWLQGAPNRYLYYVQERLNSGNVYPKSNMHNRPASGAVWPRPRIFRYGS